VGHLGRQHARIHSDLAAEGLTESVVVCDLDEEIARRVSSERKVEWTADWREVIGRVDAVSLADATLQQRSQERIRRAARALGSVQRDALRSFLRHARQHLNVVRILREHFSSECKRFVGFIADNVSFESCRLEDFSLLLRRENRICSFEEGECDHAVFDLQDFTCDHFSHIHSCSAVWKLRDEVFGGGEFGRWIGGEFDCRERVGFSR